MSPLRPRTMNAWWRCPVAHEVPAQPRAVHALLIGERTNLWLVALIMFVRGLPWAFIFVSLQTTAFATTRSEDLGRASAVFNSLRQVAASLGVALLGTVLAVRIGAHDAVIGDSATVGAAVIAFHEAFAVAAVLGLVAVGVAWFLIDDRRAREALHQTQQTSPGRS